MNKTLLKLAAVGAAVTMLLSLLMIAGCKLNPSPNNTTNSGSGNHTTENNLDTTDHEGVEDVFQDIDVPINGDQDDTQSGEIGGELVDSRPNNSGTGQSQSGQNTQLQNPQPSTPSTSQPQTSNPEQSQSSQPSQPEGTDPVDPIAAMTYEKFRGLPSSEKMAFRRLFVDKNGNVDDEAFIVWYNNAQKEYEASKDKTDDLDLSTAPRD